MITDPEAQGVKTPRQPIPRRSLIRRVMLWIAAMFLPLHFVFLVVGAGVFSSDPTNSEPPGWFVLYAMVGGLAWFASACWIYQELLEMAEALWPGAKGIRAILRPFLKSLFSPQD